MNRFCDPIPIVIVIVTARQETFSIRARCCNEADVGSHP